jgi:hypothetical protein
VRYTEDPASYIPPTQRTIEHIAQREGLGELTQEELDCIWDILAKTAGAEVREFDEVEAQADAASHALDEAQAFMARNPSLDCDEWNVVEEFEDQFHLHQHQRYDALEQVDLNQLPGYNKPTQAVRLLWLFRAMQRLWILRIIYITGLSFIESLAAAFDKIEALDEVQMEMLEAFVGSDNPNEEAVLLGLQLAMSSIQVDEMLRIARTLSELAELQSDRAKLTPDPNGEEVVLKDIEELRELGKASQSAFALPPRLRMQRAVSGELGVRDPRTRRDRKQLLFMVVDGSGSMLRDQCLGASRAAGIVMNRLRAVIDGNAELYLRFFDGALREEEFHADSPESARDLMRIISDPGQYMGNSTKFEDTLRAASNRSEVLLTARGLRDPEIVFITDGKAMVPDLSTLGGKKLHVFQVGEEEKTELSDLARQSGGVGIYVGVTVETESDDWEMR